MGTETMKCPNCGGPLHFEPELQKNKCEYCLSEFTNEELKARVAVASEEKYFEEDIDSGGHSQEEPLQGHNHGQEDHLKEYTCNSCGANVVTEDTTATTFCYYCHNPVILTDRLSGEFRPDKVIPFAFSRKKAIDSFLGWVSKYKFIQKEFYSDSQLEKMTGLYVPNWVAEVNANVDYSGTGTKVRVWVVGETEYTEHKEYDISRKGRIKLDNMTEIALRKIDHGLLESIGPYDLKKSQPFDVSYLNGFFSEKYDLTKDSLKPVVLRRSEEYVDNMVRGTTSAYSIMQFSGKNIDSNINKWDYMLLPVWILTYQYKGKTYIYAVNGQTGKAYGEIPLDRSKLFLTSLSIAVAVLFLLIVGGAVIW